jgi:uncharacterized repeat protein (TIGR03803 family)
MRHPSTCGFGRLSIASHAVCLAALLVLGGCSGGGSIPASTPANYTLSGTISGLPSGMSGLVLMNGSSTAQIASGNASFRFGALAGGSAYVVTLQSAPAGLSCSVAGGKGTLNSNVANVVVTCSDRSFMVGGKIAFAAGASPGVSVSGLVLANGTDTVNVPAGATSFTLPTPVAYTSSYQVTVQTQPTGMSCQVSPATPATMPAGAVTNVTVTCSDQPYALGGAVNITTPSGVAAGSLSDQGLVLTNSANGDAYTFSSNATSFTMPKSVAYGAAYALTVTTQPAGLNCAVNSPTGNMPAENVALTVSCSDQSYAISGTVTITAPTGVSTGSLSNQGLALTNSANGDTYTFTASGTTFAMATAVPYGSAYALSVTSQPAGLNCSVSTPSVIMPAGNITDVAVTCSDQSFTLGGTITGLGSASGLVLTNEGGDSTTILANATSFSMATQVPYGAAYAVAVSQSPTGQTCTVTQGTGTMPAQDVSAANGNGVVITCVWVESVLYSFGASGSGDGATPAFGGLIQATDGNFYGTTAFGGANGTGAVIKVTPAGQESVLYSFGVTGSGDGANPYAGVIQASDGNFYGTTLLGGVNNGGAVFQITPTGAESVLHSFGTGSDGSNPPGNLIQASDGNLYGVTVKGGASGEGAVFEIALNGAESVLYSFGAAPDGNEPVGSLLQASDGNFYGLTEVGGTNGAGTVVKVTPGGVESVLYSFGASSGDAQYPYFNSLIQASDGNMYGMTFQGGTNFDGAIFRITLAGAESVLYSFGSTSGDGINPTGSLLQATDGNLYGLTETTVVKITLAGVESTVYSFGSAAEDGESALGSLFQASDGSLYGLTAAGGTNGNGTVFRIQLP